MQERDPRPRELSDAEIQQLADEAERGYDPQQLRTTCLHTWRLGACRRCDFTGMLRDGVCGTCDSA